MVSIAVPEPDRENSQLFFLNPSLRMIFQGDRMLVSTDTEINWLSLFSNLSSPSHQLVGVPVYEDGGSCGVYGGGSPVNRITNYTNSPFGSDRSPRRGDLVRACVRAGHYAQKGSKRVFEAF